MGKTQGLRHRVAGTLAAGLGLLASGSLPAQEPAATGGFQRILWWRSGEAVSDAALAAVKQAGFTALSVSGGQDPALPARHGLRFYRDQLCGKGVFELRDRQYDPIARRYTATRDDSLLVRPAVLSSSATLAQVAELASGALAAVLPHRPIAVSLGDEISVTRHANPLDFCFAPASLRDFRAFLERRYRSVQRLNAAWGTDFASFERVRPFTADAIRARELGGDGYPTNLAPWAAHREFMDGELARLVSRLAELVARAAPQLPCGLTGLQPPSAYGGHDYQRLLPKLSFYEAYDIGGARDLAMCMARPGARQIATLFPLQQAEDPRLVTARWADLLAHGVWGTVVWSSRELLDQGRLSRFGKAVEAAHRTLGPAADRFAGAALLRSPVWLVESQASVRAWWMLDSRRDGKTWIKRLSSYEATHSTSLAARDGWLRLLEDLGLQPRLVAEGDLPTRLVADPPRLLVLPATIALSRAAVAAIEGYVRGGGIAVADHTPALYDERLRLRPRPALDDLFGVQGRSRKLDQLLVDQGRVAGRARLPSGAGAAERGLRARVSDPVGDFHVQLEHRLGTGTAHYLNLAVCEYGRFRLDPAKVQAAIGLRRRVRHVLREARVEPPLLVEARGLPTCIERTVLQRPDGQRLIAVRLNALAAPAILARLAAAGPYQATLRFPRELAVLDLATGKTRPAARAHEFPLDPYTGIFLAVPRR